MLINGNLKIWKKEDSFPNVNKIFGGFREYFYYFKIETWNYQQQIVFSWHIINNSIFFIYPGGPSWLWSYGSWINNYLCNQCLSPLKLWVRTQFMTRCTRCDKFCQWLATGRWFSPGTLVSSTNKTDCHYRTEIFLKVALNTITLSPNLSHQYSSPSVTM